MIKHKFQVTFLTTVFGKSVKFEEISNQFKGIEL